VAGYLAGCVLALAGFRFAGRATGQLDARPASASPAASDIPRRLWTYALPLTAVPLIGWVSGQADRYLVGGLAGFAAAGVYAALYGLASKPFIMLAAGADSALRQPYYARASAGDHAAERRALVYTVNDAARARELIALGIDGIVTDAVDLFSPRSPPEP